MKPTSQFLTVLHVVDSLEFGGLERVVADLAIAQTKYGHKVIVFSINPTNGLLPELLAADIPVVLGGKSSSIDFGVLRKLRKTAVGFGVDVVHAHNFVPNYYAAAALIGVDSRPPLVGTCHDMGNRLSNRKLRWLYRLSLLRTARVAMVGQQVHDRYVASGVVKATSAEIVMNGIPVRLFNGSTERRQNARKVLGLSDDLLVIGCVGRLVQLKNQRLVVECMPALLRLHPTLHLVVVGDGPLESALHAQALSLGVAAHIEFLGNRSDVADLLPAFDIFALCSSTEGLSIALLEACASSLAVVATNVGGNPEIIQDGQTGLLIPVDDHDALRNALHSLLADPALRARLGAGAAEWTGAHASIDALCSTYNRFYLRAM
jgi:glycosyltransferase involved in cell wall biosynthesis